jgi:hypothetical protein
MGGSRVCRLKLAELEVTLSGEFILVVLSGVYVEPSRHRLPFPGARGSNDVDARADRGCAALAVAVVALVVSGYVVSRGRQRTGT